MRVAVALPLALAALSASAGAPAAERELLGVRIWRDWRAVLAKHGQPTRIEVGATSGPVTRAQGGGQGLMGGPSVGGLMMPGMPPMMGVPGGAGSPNMGLRGGLPGMPGMGMAGTAPMMGTGSMMPPGMGGGMTAPMMGMGGGAPTPPMMSGVTGPMSAMMGRGPSMFGGGRKLGDDSESPLGMAGGGMPGIGMPGIGMPGLPRGGISGQPGYQSVDSGEGEVTWVYERGPNTYLFLFNKDGRVIQIQSFGYKAGGITSRGLTLGDATSKVYRLYGWPDSISKSGDTLTLDYSHKAHAAFQLVDRNDGKGMKVVGITVALMERESAP